MDKEKEIEQFAKDLERCQVYADIGGYQTDFMETARSLCYEGYRKADEVRKEMCGEIEKLKSALDDAIHSFTRMETLYKIKCFNSETETAKKIFTEWYHDVKALGEDAEYIKEKAWKEYGVEVDE